MCMIRPRIMFENPAYKDAFVGVSHDDRAVYNYDLMVASLMVEDPEMTYEEAEEFIQYNTIRSLPYYPDGPIVFYPAKFEELEDAKD